MWHQLMMCLLQITTYKLHLHFDTRNDDQQFLPIFKMIIFKKWSCILCSCVHSYKDIGFRPPQFITLRTNETVLKWIYFFKQMHWYTNIAPLGCNWKCSLWTQWSSSALGQICLLLFHKAFLQRMIE